MRLSKSWWTTLSTSSRGSTRRQGLLVNIVEACSGLACKLENIDCMYGADIICDMSVGFSLICCMRLVMPGDVNIDPAVPGVLVPAVVAAVDAGAVPPEAHGLGAGSLFSAVLGAVAPALLLESAWKGLEGPMALSTGSCTSRYMR